MKPPSIESMAASGLELRRVLSSMVSALTLIVHCKNLSMKQLLNQQKVNIIYLRSM
jgi:hypothetical protein